VPSFAGNINIGPVGQYNFFIIFLLVNIIFLLANIFLDFLIFYWSISLSIS
jgi:hypothetical protein